MPELDTLRGLAILGVVFYHGLYEGRNLSGYGHVHASILKLMALGQSGVALFFVLSGSDNRGVCDLQVELKPPDEPPSNLQTGH
jgi:hypothetical protein